MKHLFLFLVPLGLILLSFVSTGAASAHSRSTQRPAECTPTVTIGSHPIDFFHTATQIQVSPCAIAALRDHSATPLVIQLEDPQPTLATSAVAQALTPIITQGLHWRTPDVLKAAATCPGPPLTLSITSNTLGWGILPLGEANLITLLRNAFPSSNTPLYDAIPFSCSQ